jgi:hypothetical protein
MISRTLAHDNLGGFNVPCGGSESFKALVKAELYPRSIFSGE